MINYVIATKGGFEVVEGHKLNKDFGAHKNDKGVWTITDLASGLKVFGDFSTVNECRIKVKQMTEEEKQTLETKRKGERYAEYVSKKKLWITDNVPDQCEVE